METIIWISLISNITVSLSKTISIKLLLMDSFNEETFMERSKIG